MDKNIVNFEFSSQDSIMQIFWPLPINVVPIDGVAQINTGDGSVTLKSEGSTFGTYIINENPYIVYSEDAGWNVMFNLSPEMISDKTTIDYDVILNSYDAQGVILSESGTISIIV